MDKRLSRRLIGLGATGMLCMAAMANEAFSEDSPEPAKKLTVNQVMRYAMTQGLCQRVIKDKATPEEQERLVSLFEQLVALKPPQGSEESWQEKTNALLAAAKKVAAGESAHKGLKQAANCAACHKEHRPK